MSAQFQNNNILANFYTDSHFSYILNSSIVLFPSIVDYCKNNIPQWIPNNSHLQNKIAFKHDSIFEIIYYKNIITLVPLYIGTYLTLDYDLIKIKTYLDNYIKTEANNNEKLLKALNTKLYVYTPSGMSTIFQINTTLTSTSIINNKLVYSMYESSPMSIAFPELQIKPNYIPM
jgi:hypothetical protein